MKLETKVLHTDVLVVGGGTAGCFAALTMAERSDVNVLIAEKANIKRSGCLAAGVNALNAYIVEGQSPESYLAYVRQDAAKVIREDLVYSMSKRLNAVTAKLEKLGLVILKDRDGKYMARGNRNIKINGENIKVLLAEAAAASPGVTVLNQFCVTDYIVDNGVVTGAYGFSITEPVFYAVYAKAVICTTGGAAGLYRPNNPGFSRHKMWYSPFNTGAGYAMGIRKGAEMTTFEMRFIALRCKDTIAPTGTIAQGVWAPQINSRGEEYEKQYGVPNTSLRLYSTVQENQQGRGPCYLKTAGITAEQEQELYKAYLNMAPSQTLRWQESGRGPAVEHVEIEGTEPYIVGGHTGSGYWVDTRRRTTLPGLYAAGDVAGGSPQKYVTGCLAEAEIAALAVLEDIQDKPSPVADLAEIDGEQEKILAFLTRSVGLYQKEQLEEAMQKTMDEYAGGITVGYVYNRKKLQVAQGRIEELLVLARQLSAGDMHQLMHIHELLDRLYVCKTLIAHLAARQETRWRAFQENADYPCQDDEHWLKYVNSRQEAGQVRIVLRNIVEKDEIYEHTDQ